MVQLHNRDDALEWYNELLKMSETQSTSTYNFTYPVYSFEPIRGIKQVAFGNAKSAFLQIGIERCCCAENPELNEEVETSRSNSC